MDISLESLTKAQWQPLSEFGLRAFKADESLTIAATNFLDERLCFATLERIMPAIGAPNIKVAASLVLKRIAFLTLAPLMYAMSCFNRGLDLGVENTVFRYAQEAGHWQSTVALKSVAADYAPSERTDWRTQLLKTVFSGFLARVVEQFHQLTRAPKHILWENIAIRVFNLYERRVFLEVSEAQRATAQEDFAYLLDDRTTEIFGLSRNPIAEFYFEISKVPHIAEPIRIRRTCCCHYQTTDPADYCGSCPLPLRLERRKTKEA